MANQNPEQIARDQIDTMLEAAGWSVQDQDKADLGASRGVAIREWPTEGGLKLDYLLVVDGTPCGLIEAKRPEKGQDITTVEEQSEEYATSSLNVFGNDYEIRFVYESTGVITRFRDRNDPNPRSRIVFSFFRPETLAEWMGKMFTLRADLRLHIPPLEKDNLRACQYDAISNLEESFALARPRALVHMATGAGKTFTAITSVYRLLKYANAKRVLILVDTRQLGEQMEGEFLTYQPVGEQHKFPELYHVQRLSSSSINSDAKVCISTIQRMYSILRGEALDESKEEDSEAAHTGDARSVEYNAAIPPEFFDFIIVDECHRSIYNLWRQVIEYFDAFLTGLTATPDARALAFFNGNRVSEYTHEQAIIDGVNVGGEVYTIETKVTKDGGTVSCEQQVLARDKMTREERWQQLDEDLEYEGKDLDRSVVNKNQIRTIITEFKRVLFTKLFPDRKPDANGWNPVPKTLIFAKDDSHANDIVDIVREVFDAGNDFCKKVTYTADEDPKSVLSQFRNGPHLRIAVTVDMIATGTDVRPLECLIFMRDVRSANYFEQMKGRGTRTITLEELQKVTPNAKVKKTHYVLVDAVGVCASKKRVSGIFEKNPSVPLDDLLKKAVFAHIDADEATTLAGRLLRLNQVLTPQEERKVAEMSGGKSLKDIASGLYYAFEQDVVNERTAEVKAKEPALADDAAQKKAQRQLVAEACRPFNGELRTFIVGARKAHDQILDQSLDRVSKSEWAAETAEKSRNRIKDFNAYLESVKDEVEVLSIYYAQPYRRKEVTLKMIREFLEKLDAEKPTLAPEYVWESYRNIGEMTDPFDGTREAALLALIRRTVGIDQTVTPISKTVEANYKAWAFAWNNSHPNAKIAGESAEFMQCVRDFFKTGFHMEKDDFDLGRVADLGGYFKFRKIFGADLAATVLDELNAKLAA